MKVVVSNKVDEQLAALADWIRRDNPEAARRFLEAVYSEFEFIGRWPEAAPKARFRKKSLQGVRYRAVHRPFQNYIVFYRARGSEVFVGAVLWGGTNWQEDFGVF